MGKADGADTCAALTTVAEAAEAAEVASSGSLDAAMVVTGIFVLGFIFGVATALALMKIINKNGKELPAAKPTASEVQHKCVQSMKVSAHRGHRGRCSVSEGLTAGRYPDIRFL